MRVLAGRFHQNEHLRNIGSRRAFGQLLEQQGLVVHHTTSAFTLIQPNDINGVSLLAILAGVYASQRPVGWSIAAVQVRESPVSGKGVFAVEEIAAETVIGRYPGVLRSAAEILKKAGTAPRCKDYAFQIDDGRFWDPTDAEGTVSSNPGPGVPWFSIDPTLAFVNEPPPGGSGCNVTVENGASPLELVFRTVVTIREGDELFVDYGTQYDRTSYT